MAYDDRPGSGADLWPDRQGAYKLTTPASERLRRLGGHTR